MPGKSLYHVITLAQVAGFTRLADGADLAQWKRDVCQTGAADWYGYRLVGDRIEGPEETAEWPNRMGVFPTYRKIWKLAVKSEPGESR